jgi:heme/copper-type cytochrome/quinol oxidase subunit 2
MTDPITQAHADRQAFDTLASKVRAPVKHEQRDWTLAVLWFVLIAIVLPVCVLSASPELFGRIFG